MISVIQVGHPEWVELTDYEQETFNCGVEFGCVSPEDFISDGGGPYLKTVIPALRIQAYDLEEFDLLLSLFWAGQGSVDNSLYEEDFTQ